MANNAAYYDNIRHTLKSIHDNDLIITDPIGYETSEEEFTRTIENIGIISNFSTDLKFIGTGLTYIENIASNYGLNETITILKEGQDPVTDEWVELYTSTLDLTTYSVEDDELSVKINSGGFDKTFKARESENLEIENTTTIDGVTIPELVTKELEIQGREIFLKSIFETSENDNSAYLSSTTKDNNNVRGVSVCIPLSIVGKSHDNAQEPYPNTTTSSGDSDGTNGIMFFANSERNRTLDVDINLKFTPNVNVKDTSYNKFWVRLVVYKDGVDYVFANKVIEIWFEENINNLNGQEQSITYSGTLNLLQGESASLQFTQQTKADLGLLEGSAHLKVDCVDIEADLTITEDSTFESTTTQALSLFNLGERQTQLITGETGRFKSSVLGSSGKWENLITYCGHWLRGFNLTDDLYKKYTTSFKDYSETLKSILNVHIGFQNINGIDEIVAEDFEYFFNPNVVLVLPTPLANVKRYVAEDFIFSSVECGYEKGATVEGVMGLDEPNGTSNWLSNFTAVSNKYSIISPYIAGVYDEEKQRRYQKEDYPTLDTDRDSDIYIKDCKDVSGTLTERLWVDDFAVEPTGIFSPGTAKNLRLSPANNLRRHSGLLATPLKHYQSESLAFGSSTGNSSMQTQLIGGSSVSENGNVPNSAFGTRLFEPYYIEGEHLVDTGIINTLRDFSTFSGVDVPNFYCKVEFTIEGDDTVRHGYIMSVKPDGAGKWKFIEAVFNPIPVDPEYV